ncbi:MAG: extracellular solute-binding protein [Treponema sp.]|jgi:multiple sugar transport system substrate-binding protein|nr:extracellular solute-binding protein [Treponema sp.]
MKRFIASLFLFFTGFALIFAGGGAQSGGGAKKTLVYYTWDNGGQTYDIKQNLIDDWEAANPGVTVERNYVSYGEYHVKLNAMVAANATPDVFQQNQVNEWGDQGMLEDLKPLYQQAGLDPDKLYPKSLTYTGGGHLWGIGTAVNPGMGVLYYNKKLFREAGIPFPPENATTPWPWQQFAEAAKKLTKDSKGRTPNDPGFSYEDVVQWGTMMPTSSLWWMALLYTTGNAVANPDGTGFGMNNADSIRVIQSIADLSLKDRSAPSTAMTSSDIFGSAPTMLMNDQLAMVFGGNFEYSAYTEENYEVGLANFPTFSSKTSNAPWTNGVVLKKGASAEAFDLLVSVCGSEQWAASAKKRGYILPNGLPPTPVTAANPSLNDGITNSFSLAMMKLQAGIMGDPNTKQSEEMYLKDFRNIMDSIITPEFDLVFMGEKTAAQAMRDLASNTQGKFQGRY